MVISDVEGKKGTNCKYENKEMKIQKKCEKNSLKGN